MNKFRLLLTLVATVALGLSGNAARTLSAGQMAKLKGNVAHPFSALHSNKAFGEAPLMSAPSLASPLAESDGPAVSITNAGGWGTLVGPDGTDWFYSQTFTMNPTNKWYYGSTTITIYNDFNEKVWDFTIDIPDETLVNQISPFGKITRSFFERNSSSYEVMVYVHRIVSPGVATSDIDVYSSDGAGKVVGYPNATGAMLVSEGTNAWSMNERLALCYLDEDGDEQTYRFDVLRKGTYAEGANPVVDHSFTIDYNTTHYTDGSTFFIQYMGGKFYYVLSHYEKPYMESYDWNTGDVTYSEDNNFIVEVYDQNYEKVGGITTEVEMGGSMPMMYAFNVFSDNDLSLGYFTGDNQLNLVLATYDYVTESDSYTYYIDVYNAQGEIIKPIAGNVSDWRTLGAIEGQEDQMALLKSDSEGVPYYELVNLPSCDVVGQLTSTMDNRLISSNFDRVKHGDSYMYVIGMGQGDVDEQKNVISSVAWYTKELTLDHYTYFNIGPNGEMFTPILYTAYLNPYIFDTDDEMEYIYIAKIKRTDGSGKVDNVLCIANEDGSVIRKFEGNEVDGVYSNGSLLNLGTTHPSIFVAYQNSSANTFRVDFFNLPLNKFQGGTGTKEDPYLVACVGDLLQVQNNQKAYFKQIADIDLFEHGTWEPVDLKGGYDGDNHYIINAVLGSDKENVGIFGTVTGEDGTNPAYIKNLSLIYPTINGNDNNALVAPLAGEVVATEIDNVNVFGPEITWNSTYAATVGGVVAHATFQSKISNCSVTKLNVISDHANEVGGILGKLGNSTHVSNCAVTMKATGRNSIGGIAGSAGTVTNDGSITNCHADVDITAENNIGGIAGTSNRILISNCYATGKLVATAPEYQDYDNPFYSAGGIVGTLATDWNQEDKIVVENCVAALTSISVNDPNNTENRYIGLNRIAGSTANDLGIAQYKEKGIKSCYANSAMTINGFAVISASDDTAPNGADKKLDEMNKEFFESIGYAYGSDATAPWVDAALPYLYFENNAFAAYATLSSMTVTAGEKSGNGITVVGGAISSIEITSSDETIATAAVVAEESHFVAFDVTGVAEGKADITVVVDGTLTVTVKVNVVKGSSVEDVVATKATISVKGNEVIATDAQKLEIYNISGMCVAKANADTLDVAHLAQGIYVAVATNAAGERTTMKFVKK